ncbi:hypothetical protein D3C72_1064880 [compost metagenome]
MVNLPVSHHCGFLINARPTTAEHLLNKRTPAHITPSFFRQGIVIHRPAVCTLQHRITRGSFGMFHHLKSVLPTAPGANADMNHIITIEHFGWRQGIDRFKQLAGNTFGLFQRAVRE